MGANTVFARFRNNVVCVYTQDACAMPFAFVVVIMHNLSNCTVLFAGFYVVNASYFSSELHFPHAKT